MQESIDYKDINKMRKYIPFDINTNSKLYKDGNYLIKIPYYMDEELFKTLLYIDEKKIKGIIKVTNFIKDNDKEIGYRIVRYKNYKSLNKYKNRSIDLKLKDCQKIVDLFMNFNNYKLIYSDHHTGNILFNSETDDMKVCDLDSFRIRDDDSSKERQLRGALELCTQYIYNLYNDEAEIVLSRSVINVDKNNYIREAYDSIGKPDFKQKVKRIEKIDRGAMLTDKIRIKEEVRNFINSGYYRYY